MKFLPTSTLLTSLFLPFIAAAPYPDRTHATVSRNSIRDIENLNFYTFWFLPGAPITLVRILPPLLWTGWPKAVSKLPRRAGRLSETTYAKRCPSYLARVRTRRWRCGFAECCDESGEESWTVVLLAILLLQVSVPFDSPNFKENI